MNDAKAAYKEFLRTEQWLKLRDECLRRDGLRCRLCNSSDKLHAHHRHYPRKWNETELDDLTTLCKNCHDVFHAYQNPSARLSELKTNGVPPAKESRYKSVVSLEDVVDYKTLLYARMKNLIDQRTFEKEVQRQLKQQLK